MLIINLAKNISRAILSLRTIVLWRENTKSFLSRFAINFLQEHFGKERVTPWLLQKEKRGSAKFDVSKKGLFSGIGKNINHMGSVDSTPIPHALRVRKSR